MPSPPKVPTPPSPAETAASQIDVNRQGASDFATLAGVNQQTPFGSLAFNVIGHDEHGVPIRSATTTLAPAQQALLDILTGSQRTAGTAGQNLLTNASYGEVPDLSTVTGGVVDTNLQRFLGHVSPYFEQQTQQLDTQLRNQGLLPGSQAYDRAMRSLRDNQFQSVQGFEAQMEPEAFRQATTSYTLPLTTAQTLIGMGQPASLPSNLVATPQAQQFQPPNLGQLQQTANQAAQFNYNAQLQQQMSLLNGIASLGSAGLAFLL